MNDATRSALLAIASMLLATPALAHPGHAIDAGFVEGFLHPISGLDHLLAMLLVGALAALLGGFARWLVPMSFLAFMFVGGAIGFAGLGVPHLEAGIAVSVLVLGGSVALNTRLSSTVAMAIAAVIAVLHGAAHGMELPAGVGPLSFAAGFLLSTALLQLVGFSLALAISARQVNPKWTTRFARFSGAPEGTQTPCRLANHRKAAADTSEVPLSGTADQSRNGNYFSSWPSSTFRCNAE